MPCEIISWFLLDQLLFSQTLHIVATLQVWFQLKMASKTSKVPLIYDKIDEVSYIVILKSL